MPSTSHTSGSRQGFALALAVLLLSGQALPGQQEPTFSTDVKVVNVFATVRNKQGQIIRSLTKDDFTVEEDGRPQTIRYFSRESDLPLTLGLLVDTSMSQARILEQERSASYTFLDQVLRQNKDSAFVIHFDREVELLQELTSSRQQLQEALGSLRTPEPMEGGGGPRSSPGGSWPGGPSSGPGTGRGGGSRGRGGFGAGPGTTLYDAVFLASDELMKKQQGRKALIILSDGVDTGSKVSLASAIEAAQRADTLVYSILFYDDQAYRTSGGDSGGGRRRGGISGGGWPGGGGTTWPGGGGTTWPGGGGGNPRFPQQTARPDGKKILEQLSRETGGRLFEVSKKQSVEQIYSSIQEELRNQYSLGYSSDRPGAGYRKITLTAKQKDMIVQTRDGYYAER